MLADAVAKMEEGRFKDFKMNDDERYELFLAAWLHDCCKVATPPHVVDKGTKLETIFDRNELIRTRTELLKKDQEIAFLKRQLNGRSDVPFDKEYNDSLKEIESNMKFLEECNVGGEFMNPELQDRVRSIGKKKIKILDREQSFLSNEEIQNLNIP